MILTKIPEKPTLSSKKLSDAHIQHPSNWRGLFWQWFRYCLVGVANTLIDVLILFVLTWCLPTTQVQTLVIYNSLAYIGGAVSSFFLNKYWTFGHRQQATIQEVRRFVVSMFLEILSSNGLVWIIGTVLHPLLPDAILWGNSTKLLAVGFNTVISYLIMRYWIFASMPHTLRKSYPTASGDLAFQPVTSSSTKGRAKLLKNMESPVKGPITTASLSVILPVYNEEVVIASTVATVLETLTAWSLDFEIIVVNDGSQDATAAILESIAAAHPRVKLLHHERNQGYGATLAHGFAVSTKDLIFFMDSDGQFDIRDLEDFFPQLRKYDAVLGYRIKRQDLWIRKLNAWGWKVLVQIVLGVSVRDIDCAFKLYPGTFLRELHLETRGAMINAEILYKFKRAGLSFTQSGVRHLPRSGGQATGAKPAVILRALRELFLAAWKWHVEKG